MKSWIKKWYKIAFAIIIIVGLCCIPFIWNDWFFGTKTTIAETLKYVGAFIGGILIAVNAYFIYKRVEEQNRNNNLVAKGQLDTRFKDAATLLAVGNTSAELSGIHALNQIAIEASKTEDQQDYVKVIKSILIAFIKENSVIEYKKDENGKILLGESKNPIVENAYNTKSDIVLQTIIDKLFKEYEGRKIYAKYSTDLRYTVLERISFSNAELKWMDFSHAQLKYANFGDAKLDYVRFENAQLQYANFKMSFSRVVYRNEYIFNKDINNVTFRNTFWNEKTNFKDTAFEKKTIEELTKIMGNPPTPLE